MYAYTFHWLHIPTGKSGRKVRAFPSELCFRRELDRWNGSPNWKYWSGSQPARPLTRAELIQTNFDPLAELKGD